MLHVHGHGIRPARVTDRFLGFLPAAAGHEYHPCSHTPQYRHFDRIPHDLPPLDLLSCHYRTDETNDDAFAKNIK
jgi:hypothetical protein